MTQSGRKRRRNTIIYWALATVCMFFLLFPIYWMVISSFKNDAELFAVVPTFVPRNISWEAYYNNIFKTGTGAVPFWKNLLNSLSIATSTAIFSTVLATFSAYGLARFPYRLNKVILLMFMITQMFPTVLFMTPLFITFKKIGILNTHASVMAYASLYGIPFCVLTMRPHFLSVPKELEDSALLDGCSKLKFFTRVVLPITYPGIIVSFCFTFLWGWGDLMGPLTFLHDGQKMPLTVNMYQSINQYGVEWNSLMAYAVIVTIPVLLMFIFFQKYMVEGLTAGAVKG